MAKPSPHRAPLVLSPKLRRYAWGDPELIPRLLGLESSGEPVAEAWYGAHPLAPAVALAGAGDGEAGEAEAREQPRTLDALIASDGHALLGERVSERYGALPYLLKIIAAARPLSVQVHPPLSRASAGFDEEEARGLARDAPERVYRDAQHKPELLVALTPFFALAGFRDLATIGEVLEALPELHALLPKLEPGPEGLRALLESWFALPDAQVAPALEELLARLDAERAEGLFGGDDPRFWALAADEALRGPRAGAAERGGEPDRGLLFVFLLELLRLEPGEALFVAPGVLHAYLEGAAVELMASSDNVLRGGLTDKHVAPRELLRVARFDATAPPRIRAVELDRGSEALFPTPARELALSRVRLAEGGEHELVAEGPLTLLVLPALPASEAGADTGAPAGVAQAAALSPAAGPLPRGAEGLDEATREPGAGEARAPAPENEASRAPSGRPPLVSVESESGSLALGAGEAAFLADGSAAQLRGHGDALVFIASVPTGEEETLGAYRGRRPTRLAFGTSGLRGLVSDITDLEAYVNTRGFLDYLVEIGDAVPGTRVALGGDLRPSTDGKEQSILRAVSLAVIDAGMRPVHCGRLPTPALMHFGVSHAWPSIMVTGSHIPFDRNGIKFNKSSGEVLKHEEAPILEAVARVRRREYARSRASSPFDDAGWLRDEERASFRESGVVEDAAEEARALYLRRYLDSFPAGALSGLRVALYEHSAVGRELIAELLRSLGAEVHALGRSETFVAIDTEAVSPERLAELQRLADGLLAEHGALDAIVSTDGDSDRPMVLGIDEEGAVLFVGGDVLGALVADALAADAIAVPVSANDLIERHFGPRGVPVVRTRIGSPFVIAAMEELEGARRVGWEANGGFMTGSPIALEAGVLDPLPTRDAALPIVAVLHAARARETTIGGLVEALPRRASRAGLLDGVEPATSRALIEAFGPGDPAIRRVRFVRAQGPQVGASAATPATHVLVTPQGESERPASLEEARRALARRSRLLRHFPASRGFGALEELDALDGLRLHFAGGEVAHVRPSGNAPQLRIYALADEVTRAQEIVDLALEPKTGVLRALAREAEDERFVAEAVRNVDGARELFAEGEPPAIIGTVSGSVAAQAFWQRQLGAARESFRARRVLSLHEDLPVNQAFGVLLAWQRLREHLDEGEGALLAFVFGEGTRAAPMTEAECGQKPALSTFVYTGRGAMRRPMTIVELALHTFAPVEAHLRRSGFEGFVVKWGDDVQIPRRDLSGRDPLFEGADVVRFVSMQVMSEESARHKDWVGVDDAGRVRAFIPRRPLAEMAKLAERGLVQRRGGLLVGGVNLGSIALSRVFADQLLEEFATEVNDPAAKRSERPDLDPQLFTALMVALIDDLAGREEAWVRAKEESAAMRALEANMPRVLVRLRSVVERFTTRVGREPRVVAMDFGGQYWGDVGQHRQMHDFFLALRDPGPEGRVARRLAGIDEVEPDEAGNVVAGHSRLGPGVRARGSVFIDAEVEEGEIVDSVLVGTRAGRLDAREAFDVLSSVRDLRLAHRAGGYKIVEDQQVELAICERATTLFVPGRRELLRVDETLDLRDRDAHYARPIMGNALSFAEAHEAAKAADPEQVESLRRARRAEIEAAFSASAGPDAEAADEE